MKGQSEFVTSYMDGPLMGRGGWEGPGSKPCTISPNFSSAVQSKVYSYPAGCSYTKTTLHTATTLPPVTIICFEI